MGTVIGRCPTADNGEPSQNLEVVWAGQLVLMARRAGLSDLARRGLVRSSGDRWLLFGDAPRELFEVDADLERDPPGTPRAVSRR